MFVLNHLHIIYINIFLSYVLIFSPHRMLCTYLLHYNFLNIYKEHNIIYLFCFNLVPHLVLPRATPSLSLGADPGRNHGMQGLNFNPVFNILLLVYFSVGHTWWCSRVISGSAHYNHSCQIQGALLNDRVIIGVM